jgi:hypothetical protein
VPLVAIAMLARIPNCSGLKRGLPSVSADAAASATDLALLPDACNATGSAPLLLSNDLSLLPRSSGSLCQVPHNCAFALTVRVRLSGAFKVETDLGEGVRAGLSGSP